MEPQAYLKEALALAAQGRGRCAPNPAVGCIVVRDGRIIGRGFHQGCGQLHAEVNALHGLSDAETIGALVYVTLEPCCHHGRTPPCTTLLINKKVKAVYYGFADPNPLVAGQGQAALQAAGIHCERLDCVEINRFYDSYAHWTQRHRPWVTGKLALSLDGKVAGSKGEPLSITNPSLQALTHDFRDSCDALLTSAKTIICDDPQLTVRKNGKIFSKKLFILDPRLEMPESARLLTLHSDIILLHKERVDRERVDYWQGRGIVCVQLPEAQGCVDLDALLDYAGEQGVHDLWLEAGPSLLNACLSKGLLQRLLLYVAPKIYGMDALEAFPKPMNFIEKAKTLVWQVAGNNVYCDMRF